MANSQSSQDAGGCHGQATIDRPHARRARKGPCGPRSEPRGAAVRTGCIAPGAARRVTRTDCGGPWRGPRHRRSVPDEAAPTTVASDRSPAAMGWQAPRFHELGRGAGVLAALGRALLRRRHARGGAAARGAGPAPGPPGGALRCVSHAGAPRLAQGRSRHSASKERSGRAGALEKDSRALWQPSGADAQPEGGRFA